MINTSDRLRVESDFFMLLAAQTSLPGRCVPSLVAMPRSDLPTVHYSRGIVPGVVEQHRHLHKPYFQGASVTVRPDKAKESAYVSHCNALACEPNGCDSSSTFLDSSRSAHSSASATSSFSSVPRSCSSTNHVSDIASESGLVDKPREATALSISHTSMSGLCSWNIEIEACPCRIRYPFRQVS
eukprot:5290760-Pleurochrysis_carterae.AAC.4